jgi:hypothetical protein
MTHHIDINNVLSIEIGPAAPDLLSALDGKRYSRRIVVHTKLGPTTITLRAERASDLEVSGEAGSGPPGSGPPGPGARGRSAGGEA